MRPARPRSRREFLDTLTLTPLAATVAGGLPSRADARGTHARGASAQDAVMPFGSAPPDLPRPTTPSQADLGANYGIVETLGRSTGAHAFGPAPFPGSYLGNKFASLEAFTTAGRAAVLDAYGYRPAAVDPAPEVIDRYEGPDFIREKVLFSTTPTFRVPAYVHVPRGLRGPAPAVVDLHSHGGMFLFGKEKVIDFGRNHPAMTTYHAGNYESRPTTTALVRRGYVVITIDAFMFGERRVLMDGDLQAGWERSAYDEAAVARLNRVCQGKESTLAKTLTALGMSWPGVVAWDDMRTVDYLLTRPEVDGERIGCLGVSFGGWRTLFLAALDERIRAACLVGFMSTIGPMLRRHVDTHSWVHFVPGLHRHLDLPDVASLTAPRALLVQQCRRDALFPLEGMEAATAAIGEVYTRSGHADQHASRYYDVPHIFNRAMQDDAFAWLDRHLRG